MMQSEQELDLPGFRFHPTEDELLDFYLRRTVHGKKLNFDIIGTLNIYRHDPWDLPKLARIGEREWYFFVPRDRKQGNSGRPNRTTERGFWKATGTDRQIRSAADPKRLVGLKKTLVFYKGRAPRGCKTDWIMNEYRLPETPPAAQHPKADIVLCKIYRKATSLKELEERAAMEEETRASQLCVSVADTVSSSDPENFEISLPSNGGDLKEVKAELLKEIDASPISFRSVNLPELQVPKYSLDWMHNSYQAPLCSPWFEQWSPCYTNMLNFETLI